MLCTAHARQHCEHVGGGVVLVRDVHPPPFVAPEWYVWMIAAERRGGDTVVFCDVAQVLWFWIVGYGRL